MLAGQGDARAVVQLQAGRIGRAADRHRLCCRAERVVARHDEADAALQAHVADMVLFLESESEPAPVFTSARLFSFVPAPPKIGELVPP